MTKRVFYDLETTHEHPQYCDMTLAGALVEEEGKEDRIYVWEAPWTRATLQNIRSVICESGVQRIGFNCLNFDNLVLYNYGITVPEEGLEDALIAVRTVAPGLPAHGLKFLCWYLLGDPHWEQFELHQQGHEFGDAITTQLKLYHRKDLEQHRAIWDWVKEAANSETHRSAYKLDMAMGKPLEEMTFEGGTYVDVPLCKSTMTELLNRKDKIQSAMKAATEGKVQNANSNKQVGQYLAKVEEFALNLTGTGEFQVKKKDLSEIVGMEEEEMRVWEIGKPLPESLSSVALLAWQMKDNENLRKYVKNYLAAAEGTGINGWIPNAYQVSRAVTRRTLSKSFYKINFQNATEAIDRFKLIPSGFLGGFIDSTQVENVVHIYESQDFTRRLAYEADPNWNEYVWLCNRILGDHKTKEQLDSIKSKQVTHWSIYKLYKTIKLALNFGMGVRKFAKMLGIDEKIARALFQDIHRACPAIHYLQNKVEAGLQQSGYVQDSFGHIYTGLEEEAYKVVAFLIQGCGTGSLPKAQLRANYDTFHKWSEDMDTKVGTLCQTTHDECTFLLRLDLGQECIEAILRELMMNMTKKFSNKFDDIPLRAKLYLSITNVYDKKLAETKDFQKEIIFPPSLKWY